MAVPGVTDGVVFLPERDITGPVQRLAALAVADGLTEAQVLASLAGEMDPIFLPRPLVLVPQLPRNEVGKLPRDKLMVAPCKCSCPVDVTERRESSMMRDLDLDEQFGPANVRCEYQDRHCPAKFFSQGAFYECGIAAVTHVHLYQAIAIQLCRV